MIRSTIEGKPQHRISVEWPSQLQVVDIPRLKPDYQPSHASEGGAKLQLISSEIVESFDPRRAAGLPSCSLYAQSSHTGSDRVTFGVKERSGGNVFDENVKENIDNEPKVKVEANPRFLPKILAGSGATSDVGDILSEKVANISGALLSDRDREVKADSLMSNKGPRESVPAPSITKTSRDIDMFDAQDENTRASPDVGRHDKTSMGLNLSYPGVAKTEPTEMEGSIGRRTLRELSTFAKSSAGRVRAVDSVYVDELFDSFSAYDAERTACSEGVGGGGGGKQQWTPGNRKLSRNVDPNLALENANVGKTVGLITDTLMDSLNNEFYSAFEGSKLEGSKMEGLVKSPNGGGALETQSLDESHSPYTFGSAGVDDPTPDDMESTRNEAPTTIPFLEKVEEVVSYPRLFYRGKLGGNVTDPFAACVAERSSGDDKAGGGMTASTIPIESSAAYRRVKNPAGVDFPSSSVRSSSRAPGRNVQARSVKYDVDDLSKKSIDKLERARRLALATIGSASVQLRASAPEAEIGTRDMLERTGTNALRQINSRTMRLVNEVQSLVGVAESRRIKISTGASKPTLTLQEAVDEPAVEPDAGGVEPETLNFPKLPITAAVEQAVDRLLEEDRQNATVELKREIEEMEAMLERKRLAYISRTLEENLRGVPPAHDEGGGRRQRGEGADEGGRSGGGRRQRRAMRENLDDASLEYILSIQETPGDRDRSESRGRQRTTNHSAAGSRHNIVEIGSPDTGDQAMEEGGESQITKRPRDGRGRVTGRVMKDRLDLDPRIDKGLPLTQAPDATLLSRASGSVSAVKLVPVELVQYPTVVPALFPCFARPDTTTSLAVLSSRAANSVEPQTAAVSAEKPTKNINAVKSDEPAGFRTLSNFAKSSSDGAHVKRSVAVESLMDQGATSFLDLLNDAFGDPTGVGGVAGDGGALGVNVGVVEPLMHLNPLSLGTQLEGQFYECGVVRRIHLETIRDWMTRRPLEMILLGRAGEPYHPKSGAPGPNDASCANITWLAGAESARFLGEAEGVLAELTGRTMHAAKSMENGNESTAADVLAEFQRVHSDFMLEKSGKRLQPMAAGTGGENSADASGRKLAEMTATEISNARQKRLSHLASRAGKISGASAGSRDEGKLAAVTGFSQGKSGLSSSNLKGIPSLLDLDFSRLSNLVSAGGGSRDKGERAPLPAAPLLNKALLSFTEVDESASEAAMSSVVGNTAGGGRSTFEENSSAAVAVLKEYFYSPTRPTDCDESDVVFIRSDSESKRDGAEVMASRGKLGNSLVGEKRKLTEESSGAKPGKDGGSEVKQKKLKSLESAKKTKAGAVGVKKTDKKERKKKKEKKRSGKKSKKNKPTGGAGKSRKLKGTKASTDTTTGTITLEPTQQVGGVVAVTTGPPADVQRVKKLNCSARQLLDCILYGSDDPEGRAHLARIAPDPTQFSLSELRPDEGYLWALTLAAASRVGMEEVPEGSAGRPVDLDPEVDHGMTAEAKARLVLSFREGPGPSESRLDLKGRPGLSRLQLSPDSAARRAGPKSAKPLFKPPPPVVVAMKPSSGGGVESAAVSGALSSEFDVFLGGVRELIQERCGADSVVSAGEAAGAQIGNQGAASNSGAPSSIANGASAHLGVLTESACRLYDTLHPSQISTVPMVTATTKQIRPAFRRLEGVAPQRKDAAAAKTDPSKTGPRLGELSRFGVPPSQGLPPPRPAPTPPSKGVKRKGAKDVFDDENQDGSSAAQQPPTDLRNKEGGEGGAEEKLAEGSKVPNPPRARSPKFMLTYRANQLAKKKQRREEMLSAVMAVAPKLTGSLVSEPETAKQPMVIKIPPVLLTSMVAPSVPVLPESDAGESTAAEELLESSVVATVAVAILPPGVDDDSSKTTADKSADADSLSSPLVEAEPSVAGAWLAILSEAEVTSAYGTVIKTTPVPPVLSTSSSMSPAAEAMERQTAVPVSKPTMKIVPLSPPEGMAQPLPPTGLKTPVVKNAVKSMATSAEVIVQDVEDPGASKRVPPPPAPPMGVDPTPPPPPQPAEEWKQSAPPGPPPPPHPFPPPPIMSPYSPHPVCPPPPSFIRPPATFMPPPPVWMPPPDYYGSPWRPPGGMPPPMGGPPPPMAGPPPPMASHPPPMGGHHPPPPMGPGMMPPPPGMMPAGPPMDSVAFPFRPHFYTPPRFPPGLKEVVGYAAAAGAAEGKAPGGAMTPRTGEGCMPGAVGNSRIYVFNQGKSICRSVQQYLIVTGPRLFDPHNIVALRAVPAIDCVVLVHISDAPNIAALPNLLKLKRDLRVKFLLFATLGDIKGRNLKPVFPKGGVALVDTASLFDCSPEVLEGMLEFMQKQTKERDKPWILVIAADAIERISDVRQHRLLDEAQVFRLDGVVRVLSAYKTAGVIQVLCKPAGGAGGAPAGFPAPSLGGLGGNEGAQGLERPRSTQEYRACALALQQVHMALHRHILFITDMARSHPDAALFLEGGVDVMSVPNFMRCFVSKPTVEHFPRPDQHYGTRLTSEVYADARCSNAIDFVAK